MPGTPRLARRAAAALACALVAGVLTAAPPATAGGELPGASVVLRTYRLALLSDPSYAAAVAPAATTEAESDAQVLAAKQALVDRLNQVYGPELAIRFTLAPGTASLNLRNAAEASTGNGPCGTEPCFPADLLAAGCSDDLMRRTRYVVGQLVGARSYEIGHLVLGSATPGTSYGSAAGTEYRAFGCTGSAAPTGDAFALDRLAHELGHQLGASASFDGTSCAEERNGDTAVEPGSGASLMGAAGTCGADDLLAHPEPWFTSVGLDEIGYYVSGDGLVPDGSTAAEVQSVALTGFDGSDSFKLSFGGVQTATITRGVNYTQDGVKAAVVAAVPSAALSKVRPFWQTGVFDDRGFEMTFSSYTDIVEPTVVPVSGSFTAQANDIDAGGLQPFGGTPSASGNKNPVVTAPADRTIPVRTPFALTGSATDADLDPLVYQWEQSDPGGLDGVALTDPAKTDGTIFRSFAPVASPTRVFPDLARVVAGRTNAATGSCAAGDLSCWSEWLPTTAYAPSSMHFRLIARDRDTGGGGTAYDEVVLTVDKATGPFRVTSQAAPASVVGGSALPVTWTANTAALAANVKISLSVDGGRTFPTVLLASTPNDGSQTVTLPETPTGAARVKVEAVGSYFFDVSHADLAITAPPTTGLTVTGVPAAPATQYSDPLVFAFTADTSNAPLESVVASLTGLPSGLTLLETAPGAWAVAGTVSAAPGTYPVHLEVGDGTDTATFDRSVVVTRESATAAYDGATSASADHGGADAVEVALSAAVAEVLDGASASLVSATATFTDQATGDVLCAAVPVDGSGDASCTYAADLPAYGGRTFQVVVSLGGSWTGSSAPASLVVTAPGPPVPTPPDTAITSAPPAWLMASSATVAYSSSEEGSTFECALDGASVPCASAPLSLTGLVAGSHRFTVAARDAEGSLDASPASTTFTVPVDDRALTVAAGPWKRRARTGAYLGTCTRVAAKNAALTYRVTDARSLALVVGTAADQGRVKVFLDGVLVGRVRLSGPLAWSRLVPLAAFSSPRSGLVRIVARSKKQVRIDGLGVSTL